MSSTNVYNVTILFEFKCCYILRKEFEIITQMFKCIKVSNKSCGSYLKNSN